MTDNRCDYCGREINKQTDKYVIVDGDMILHSDCFIEIYKERLEEYIGVAINELV